MMKHKLIQFLSMGSNLSFAIGWPGIYSDMIGEIGPRIAYYWFFFIWPLSLFTHVISVLESEFQCVSNLLPSLIHHKMN